jgi:hypothetical protein
LAEVEEGLAARVLSLVLAGAAGDGEEDVLGEDPADAMQLDLRLTVWPCRSSS